MAESSVPACLVFVVLMVFVGACVPWKAELTLAQAREQAISRLAARQHDDGYWTPVWSRMPDRKQAVPEAEVTTTGMVLLLLHHLTLEDPAIADMVRRGEAFLSDQIEPDGLVRFYGNRNVLHFGSRLPPDLGDTALVWLVAPPNAGRDRFEGVLRAMAAVTDPETGVPATWLIGGEDPRQYGLPRNPVDAQVIAEVWMMLQARWPEQIDPRLCSFLKTRGVERHFQVWFHHAPPVQRLTWKALELAGCPAPLPAGLSARLQPGQEIWDRIVQRLLVIEAAEYGDDAVADARQELEDLLLRLAVDDFRALRNDPPLIYNKETVPEGPAGYYWSEDWGLALWLRAEHALRVQGERS